MVDADLLAAWDSLYESQSAPSNPFLSSTWVLQWYDKYVRPADRVILVVRCRHKDGTPGDVVGVAAMHLHRLSIGPIPVARRLLPVGAGVGQTPFEIPGVLHQPGSAREIARSITAACVNASAHWAELPLDPGQGWFESDWLPADGDEMAFGELARARACVILPVQANWEQTRATLKRNIKESIRRSANRLKKDGRPYHVIRRSDDLDEAVVLRFLHLHQERSRLERATNRHHHDAYEVDAHRRIVLEALPQLAREGRASIFELYLGGDHVASQLALHSPGTSYVHSSGFREDTWALGVVTHLQAALIQHAVERGDTVVNFSPGPNVSKLRWSEELWISHEFAYGAGPRSLTLRFGAFTTLSSIKTTLQAASRRRRQLEAAQN